MTSLIEYRIESSLKWFKLADMSDLSCRTSLINGGYFNIYTIKLPFETYSRYDETTIKFIKVLFAHTVKEKRTECLVLCC